MPPTSVAHAFAFGALCACLCWACVRACVFVSTLMNIRTSNQQQLRRWWQCSCYSATSQSAERFYTLTRMLMGSRCEMEAKMRCHARGDYDVYAIFRASYTISMADCEARGGGKGVRKVSRLFIWPRKRMCLFWRGWVVGWFDDVWVFL